MEKLNICDCGENSNRNLVFNCGHSFCSKCLIDLCLYNQGRLLNGSPFLDGKVIIKCLNCSQGEFGISKKEIVDKLEEGKKAEKEELIMCTDHQKVENFYCIEFNQLMCENCFNTHKMTKIFKNHQSIENYKMPNKSKELLENIQCFIIEAKSKIQKLNTITEQILKTLK